jgi:hypothetical protein
MERPAGRVDVLIAGGGVAALEATLALRALAEERVAITPVAPESDFIYRPLAVAEPFRVGEVARFPLRPLVEAQAPSSGKGASPPSTPTETSPDGRGRGVSRTTCSCSHSVPARARRCRARSPSKASE